jgi:integrase/recombinase XerD
MKDITAYCEKEKVHEILRCAAACSLRDYLILRVLWESGVRVSELAALTPGDLEPHNQVINVVNGKGNKSRRVYIDSSTMDMLCDYILSAGTLGDRAIFGVKTNQMRNIVKRYGKLAGVDVHPHTFRHSFAIHLIRSGLDLRRVQQLLGHSNLNTTQVYLQFKDEDLREGYNKVEF